jgi:hypothetical protein
VPEGYNLASAYVTILPDMDKFVAELASKLNAAVDNMQPKVKVDAQLDPASVAEVEAELDSLPAAEVKIKSVMDDPVHGLLADLGMTATQAIQAKVTQGFDIFGAAAAQKAAQSAAQAAANASPIIEKTDMPIGQILQQVAAAHAAGQAAASASPFVFPAHVDFNALPGAVKSAVIAASIAAPSRAGAGIAAGIMSGANQQAIPQDILLAAIASRTTQGAMNAASYYGIPLPQAGGGGGGGGGGGFLSRLFGGLFDPGGGAHGNSLGRNLFWGNNRVPFLGALAGMGSIGSLMGFGPEHAITTGIGLAGSAAGAVIGGGLLGAGMGAVTGVG